MVVSVLLLASPARAQDAFEIQVYDGTANRAGSAGLELHLNEWATGHRTSTPPEAPLHGQAHATLEPSWGLFPFWELGAYVQFALRTDDGAFDWAGVKLRSKFVTPPSWDAHVRLGANVEVAYLPPTYDRDHWGLELRPIAAWHDDRWLLAFNPIVDQSLAGPGAGQGPSLEPALKVACTVGPIALGLEYYGNLGPIASPLPWRDQSHALFEVVDLVSAGAFELNAGVGEGLTAASAGLTFKLIAGYALEPATPPGAMASNRMRSTR